MPILDIDIDLDLDGDGDGAPPPDGLAGAAGAVSLVRALIFHLRPGGGTSDEER